MTTIAWDGRTLAADRLAHSNATKRKVRKIFDCGEYVYGASGIFAECHLIAEWLTAGARPEARLHQEDGGICGLVIRKTDLKHFVLMGKTIVLVEGCDRFETAGSGREYALAAMELGKTAAQAVTFASRFDAYTGLGVDTWRPQRKH